MRFIISVFITVFSSLSFSNELTFEDGFIKSEYRIGDFDILEYNCDCTMQENKFFVEDLSKTYISYEIFDASKVSDKNFNKKNALLSASTEYFLKNKNLCDTQEKFKGNELYIFTLIPHNDSYCYELSGVIGSNGVNLTSQDIVIKLSSEIKVDKQYLFKNKNEDSKTKMYLIKGDKVEVLKEDKDWLYVIYRGKKEIRAWIPLSSVQ
ncbi:SH3 domain-containing protein [Vibrio mangrovi]|uniref:Bacterial SH3 domain protein n=1 Tax=Vibrio mangrovi TaxID=474394 RepID=A0A1Y6ISH9_9VIBR|nr:hypothetical protein [Vibrio mangrovi]MDW6001372.1 hypothetical protein [Vibrio mangrovi]SMS00605.1 hypothetical protein VIM7927_01871 [Vibrio mangrovi]